MRIWYSVRRTRVGEMCFVARWVLRNMMREAQCLRAIPQNRTCCNRLRENSR